MAFFVIHSRFRGPGRVADSALNCESGGPGFGLGGGATAVYWLCPLEGHCPSNGEIHRAVPCIRVYRLGTLKNHRNSKAKSYVSFPLSGAAKYKHDSC